VRNNGPMTEGVDRLAVRISTFAFADNKKKSPCVEILVNGIPLWSQIEDVRNRGMAEEVEGCLGVPPSLVAPPSRHWLGDPEVGWSVDGRALIFDCECGHWPCGGTTAKISVTADLVEWSHFSGPTADSDPLSIGPFFFDRDDYEQALGQLA
jgi:hypothetical protein